MGHDITPEELLQHITPHSQICNIEWAKTILNIIRSAGCSVKRNAVKDDHMTLEEKHAAVALNDELYRHAHLYHSAAAPEITNAEYDAMCRQLVAMLLKTDWRPVNCILDNVGSAPQVGKSALRLMFPMKSLANAHTEEDIEQFVARNRAVAEKYAFRSGQPMPLLKYIIEPKFDGLAVGAQYLGGMYAVATTRGNGEVGEDVSSNFRMIPHVPSAIFMGRNIDAVVFGEVVMMRSEFIKINAARVAKGIKEYATPRNAAAGLLQSNQMTLEEAATLRFYVYGFQSATELFQTHTEITEWAAQEGFSTFVGQSDRSIDAAYHRFLKLRDVFDYDIDGVVVKLDSLPAARYIDSEVGTNHHPASAIAYKFPPDEARTTVTDIIHQVGRSGVITPVAILQPVKIGGVMVSRANLHNADAIRRKEVTYRSIVWVKRAADVIPDIDRVVGNADLNDQPDGSTMVRYKFPKNCPCCSAPLIRVGAEHFCSNNWLTCDAQRQAGLEHFVSRDAMNLVGVGPETIKRLVETGHVIDPSQFFGLSEKVLVADLHMSRSKAQAVVATIDKARVTTLARFLFSLSIPEIGKVTAEDITKVYPTYNEVYQAVMCGHMKVPGVGPSAKACLRAFFSNDDNLMTVDSLLESLIFTPEQIQNGTAMVGRVVAFSGKFNHQRSYLEHLVYSQGGQVAGIVTKHTSYLVIGTNPRSKLESAQAYGIPILSEEEFLLLAVK